MTSVVRAPFRLRTLTSSRLRRNRLSCRSRSAGTLASCICAKMRSTEMPPNSSLRMGTNAPGTACSSVSCRERASAAGSSVKKSVRVTQAGATHSMSTSEPGPCTPKRYDPKVWTLPPGAQATAPASCLAAATSAIQARTSTVRSSSTAARFFVSAGASNTCCDTRYAFSAAARASMKKSWPSYK